MTKRTIGIIIFVILFCLALVAISIPSLMVVQAPLFKSNVYKVWYGTNRKPNDTNDISKGFSGERDEMIHYGTVDVYIPESHKFGSVGSNLIVRTIRREDDRLKLQSIDHLEGDQFWHYVNEALSTVEYDETHALIYIHGFNVDFNEAAIRAAQIGFDLKVHGITSFFSWPSKGWVKDYADDETSIESSERYLTEYLTNFAKNTKADKIDVIAHSMGNRGFIRALQRITADKDSNIKFNQIILAAPDMDVDLFKDLAGVYTKLSNHTTLYVSPQDKAIITSKWLHSFPRVGLVPPVTVAQGIDTVEVSDMSVDMLGHSYYAEAKPVLCDIATLINDNTPVAERALMTPVSGTAGQYWTFDAAGAKAAAQLPGCI